VRRVRGGPANASRRPLLLALPRWLSRAGLTVIGSVAGLAGRATVLSADKANELLADAWTCSPAALERDTGWEAKTSLAQGAVETAAWYRKHHQL
jgi:hypothetical protein